MNNVIQLHGHHHNEFREDAVFERYRTILYMKNEEIQELKRARLVLFCEGFVAGVGVLSMIIWWW